MKWLIKLPKQANVLAEQSMNNKKMTCQLKIYNKVSVEVQTWAKQ